jgi:hypothetical protein
MNYSNPITLGGLYKRDWERLMACLDKSDHPEARAVKYMLQCKIDVAVEREEWI